MAVGGDEVTADEFLAFILPLVEYEAGFTEDNNEDKTRDDYLADLETLIQRIRAGEVEL